MKNYQSRILASLLVLPLLSACGSSEKKKNAGEAGPAAKAEKSASSSSQFKLRPIREVQLENGLKILFITDNSLPKVNISLLARVGIRQEPQGKEGLNNLVAQLLQQGTQSKTAPVLADEIGDLGSDFTVAAGNDFTVFSMDALSPSADKMLGIYSDILMNPAFLDAEVARMKSQIMAQQQKKVDNPSGYADDAYDAFLFQGHAYANDTSGTMASVKKITKQDVIRFYLSNYRPNNAQLAVVGRFGKDFEAKVADAFKKWAGKPIKDVAAGEAKPIQGIEMRLLSKPGLQQTQIRIGELGIRRVDEDFLRLRLVNTALGGDFGSRLNQHVRDDLGLTYSIYSSFDARADRGPFTISTFTKNETAGKTVDESLKVFTEFMTQGLNEGEFKAAKEQMLGQFPRAIETADRLAFNILVLNYYGVPLSYLQDFNKNVQAMTIEEANEAMKKHLDGKNLRILVYGDEKKVAEQLKAYNPEIVRVK